MSKLMNPDTRTGVVLLCLMCLVPLVTGGLVGAWVQRRIAQFGVIGLLPGFVRRFLDEVQYGK